MLKSFVSRREFALGEVAFVIACGVLAGLWPATARGAALAALLPSALRLAAGRWPFRRTGLGLLLLVFLATAGVGVWAAYHRPAAELKFLLIVLAILLFNALAGQPEENLWPAAGLLALAGVGATLYFLYVGEPESAPVRLPGLAPAWAAWRAVRPAFGLRPIHHNVAAGMAAALAPLLLAVGWRQYRHNGLSLVTAAWALGGLVVLAGLLASASRGAWLALGAVALLAGLWQACLAWAQRSPAGAGEQARLAFLAALLALFLVGVGALLAFPQAGQRLLERLPAVESAESRLDLYRGALALIGDFPFTGGGLASFPGLYAQYVRVVPFRLIQQPHGHNLYLDLALEQGLAGLLAGGLIYALSAAALFRRLGGKWSGLAGALLASLAVLGLHGLIDDALYGSRAVLLLFAPAGLAAALWQAEPLPVTERRRRPALAVSIGVALLAAALALVTLAPLKAAWHADLGAVQMSRVELADFPSGAWDTGQQVPALAAAEAELRQALAYAPTNRTANHRLGLIALQRRVFEQAAAYLEASARLDPGLRGIQKTLGYTYAWLGQYDLAARQLQAIPEARQELETYAWWWGQQGRPDLAERAAEMLAHLKEPE